MNHQILGEILNIMRVLSLIRFRQILWHLLASVDCLAATSTPISNAISRYSKTHNYSINSYQPIHKVIKDLDLYMLLNSRKL